MMAGVGASTAASFVSHPLDTVKVRLQLNKESKVKLMDIIRDINANEGPRGYLRGMLSTLVGRVPISTVMYTA